MKQDNIKYGTRNAVSRLSQVLIDRQLPFVGEEKDDLRDLLTLAASDDLKALTRLYLWYVYNAIAPSNPLVKTIAAQLTEWYCNHFPQMVMANVAMFADCCGPAVMSGIASMVPDVGKYLRSQGMQYYIPEIPRFHPVTPKTLRAKLRTAKAFRNLQVPS